MEPLSITVEPLTLGNACNGAANEDVQRILRDFNNMIREHLVSLDKGGLFSTKDGCLVCRITTSVTVRFNVENDKADVEVTTIAKLPAPKGKREPIRIRDDEFLVEHDPSEQLALVRPAREQPK